MPFTLILTGCLWRIQVLATFYPGMRAAVQWWLKKAFGRSFSKHFGGFWQPPLCGCHLPVKAVQACGACGSHLVRPHHCFKILRSSCFSWFYFCQLARSRSNLLPNCVSTFFLHILPGFQLIFRKFYIVWCQSLNSSERGIAKTRVDNWTMRNRWRTLADENNDDDDYDDMDECRRVVVVRRNKKVICQWCSPLLSLLALHNTSAPVH